MPLRPAATASSMVPAAALPRRDAEKNARAQPRIAQPHAPLITHAPRAVHVRCRACDFSIWLRRHASKKNGKKQKLVKILKNSMQAPMAFQWGRCRSRILHPQK